MPRDGSGVYSKPSGTTATDGQTIDASAYNSLADDLVSDANGARPVVAGGTGATTASAARTNLGVGALDDMAFASLDITGSAEFDGAVLTGADTYNGGTPAATPTVDGSGVRISNGGTVTSQVPAATGNTTAINRLYRGTTVVNQMNGNGDMANTNGVFGTISDKRLKQNIRDAASQWDDIAALRLRNFEFKDRPDEPQIGFIAQEVAEVSPGAVMGDDILAVKTSVLLVKALGALQEAMRRIEELEAKA